MGIVRRVENVGQGKMLYPEEYDNWLAKQKNAIQTKTI